VHHQCRQHGVDVLAMNCTIYHSLIDWGNTSARAQLRYHWGHDSRRFIRGWHSVDSSGRNVDSSTNEGGLGIVLNGSAMRAKRTSDQEPKKAKAGRGVEFLGEPPLLGRDSATILLISGDLPH
jgi:hypothetical protein